MLNENFWKDQNLAKSTIKQKKMLEEISYSYENSMTEIKNIKDLFQLASAEKNDEVIAECINKIHVIHKKIKKSEISCFLSGENDDLNIYLEIHAGAGGTESQDWAEMLRRMYMKWFDKKKFSYNIISEHQGEEGGGGRRRGGRRGGR